MSVLDQHVRMLWRQVKEIAN